MLSKLKIPHNCLEQRQLVPVLKRQDGLHSAACCQRATEVGQIV